MAARTQSGSSSAAVPMFTRAHPVASAAASDASSRMPPDSSTAMSSRPTTVGQQIRVRAAAERGVQVDQVHPLRPGRLPGQRGLHRVAVAGLGAGRAVHQPDRLAAGHVHRGQQGQRGVAHRIISSQLASSAAPASPDFSGWNWVAHSGPFSTTAMNGSPCVAQLISGGVIRSDGGMGSARAA